MKKKCVWSNKRSDDVITITLPTPNRFGRNPQDKSFSVLPENEAEFRGFHQFVLESGTTFLSIFMATTIGLLIVAFLNIGLPYSIAGLIIIQGFTILKYPFATPETVEMVGVKTSLKIVKIMGIGVVLLGAWIALLR